MIWYIFEIFVCIYFWTFFFVLCIWTDYVNCFFILINGFFFFNNCIFIVCDEERKRVDVVEEKKAKEVLFRIFMEKEIVVLKFEIIFIKLEVVFGNEDLNKEVTFFRICIFEREMEIYQFKQFIIEVERRVDVERECGELERKRVFELQEVLELEKIRVYEVSKMFNVVGKKDEENRFQLEILKIEVEEVKLKCEEVNRKFEIEKQKFLKEKKRVDEEKARVIE